jgi:hypothetical protein
VLSLLILWERGSRLNGQLLFGFIIFMLLPGWTDASNTHLSFADFECLGRPMSDLALLTNLPVVSRFKLWQPNFS